MPETVSIWWVAHFKLILISDGGDDLASKDKSSADPQSCIRQLDIGFHRT